MKKLSILLVSVATLIAATTQAQYNSNAGKNKAYKKVEIEEAVKDENGEVELDMDGEIIYETRIVEKEVSTDEHGNAKGNNYDLAYDGAFEGNTIAVINLCGNTMDYAKRAVAEKGFSMVEWRMNPPSPEALREDLKNTSQLWVLSTTTQKLNNEHLEIIEEFFNSGKGLYIWGDNDPLYADANFITEKLFGTTMGGNTYADQVVGISGNAENRAGMVDGHLISTGVANVYEGITVATVKATQELSPLIYGSDDNLIAAVYEKDGKRAIIDGGFTRLCVKWTAAGTSRYIKNAAAWLVNYEKFGSDVYQEVNTDDIEDFDQEEVEIPEEEEEQGDLNQEVIREEKIDLKKFFGNEQISSTNYNRLNSINIKN